MERLNVRLTVLTKALDRLKEALDLLKVTDSDKQIYSHIRDSVIQRFEFSVDIFWKCLKDYLDIKHKISLTSPRSVLKECFAQRIIDEEELRIFEDMIDDRNDTSHRYDENMSEDIAENAYEYHSLMMVVKKRLQ